MKEYLAILPLILISYLFAWNYYFLGLCLLLLLIFILKDLNSKEDPIYQKAQQDKYSNFKMNIEYYIEDLIKNSIFEYIYNKLKADKITEKSFDEWKLRLIENFKLTYKTDYPAVEIKFNIKSGILWINNEIDFLDHIFHEIYIPYEFDRDNDEQYPSGPYPLKKGIVIRLVVVNGSLKLQVGEFRDDWSPETYRSNFPKSFLTHVTIAEFPLTYVCWNFGLPSRYLNYDSIYGKYYNKELDFIKKNKKEEVAYLRGLNFDKLAYNYLLRSLRHETIWNCNLGDWGYFKNYENKFRIKAENMLKINNFVNTETESNNNYWTYNEWSLSFKNNFISITLTDNNDVKQNMREVLSDYMTVDPF